MKFRVKLLGDGKSMSFIEIPQRIMSRFGGRKHVKVKATLNGFAYRTTTSSMGDGCCVIPVRKEVRLNAKLEPGDMLTVALQEDFEERTVTIPPDLLKALKRSKAIYEKFLALSYTHRKEFVEGILGAKKSETRVARISRVIDKLR